MTDYKDADGNTVSLLKLCSLEPEWARSRIESLIAENAVLREGIKDSLHGEYDDDCPICYLDREIDRCFVEIEQLSKALRAAPHMTENSTPNLKEYRRWRKQYVEALDHSGRGT